jgi:nitric oxide reductase activation protein
LGPVDVRPYKAYRKKQRSVSVAFLVDLSSSTNELVGAEGKRIVDIQKEALVLISEALDAMGDYFSIYGFSGYGREQVAVYPVKEEKETWGPDVQQRLGNLSWKMENRDGAAIRHVTEILTRGEGTTKILLILSDGRPLDCGCSLYHDAYAQSDTRAALMETKKKGIRPFCITVDSGGAEYLSSMYGTSFAVIKQVEDVPVQLPKLYHRLIQ